MEQRAHALELIGDPPRLLFVGRRGHNEVRTARFNPVLDSCASRGNRNKKKQQRQKSLVHGGEPDDSGGGIISRNELAADARSRTSVTSAVPCPPVLAHQFMRPR